MDGIGVFRRMKKSEATGGIHVRMEVTASEKGNIVRWRLVVIEVSSYERPDVFAGTPPIAATKYLLSDVASSKDKRILVLDIKRAFLYGEIEENIYIELPDEDVMKSKGYVGKLIKAMYGTRAAPQVWQDVVRRTMVRLGFTPSPPGS